MTNSTPAEEAVGCGCIVIIIALVVMLAGALLRAGWTVMS